MTPSRLPEASEHLNMGGELALPFPLELVDAIAERLAVRVLGELTQRLERGSPWLDVEGACAYLGFSRDKLYKLTAAKAIPFRKKENGQELLFHRDELDQWLESQYPRESWLP